MPQRDIRTYIGQVTWIVLGFTVFYLVSRNLFERVIRSMMIRSKKREVIKEEMGEKEIEREYLNDIEGKHIGNTNKEREEGRTSGINKIRGRREERKETSLKALKVDRRNTNLKTRSIGRPGTMPVVNKKIIKDRTNNKTRTISISTKVKYEPIKVENTIPKIKSKKKGKSKNKK